MAGKTENQTPDTLRTAQEIPNIKISDPFLKYLLIIILFILEIAAVSAQDLVYPNMPRAMLKSNKGPISMVEYHGGLGVINDTESYSGSFSGFNVLIGYQINKRFIISGGTGLSVYSRGKLIPVFMDLRYTFYIDQLAPYFYANSGMLIDFSNFDETRIFMNPGFGVRYSLTQKIAVNMSGGIFAQAASQKMDVFVNLKTGVTYKFWRKTTGFRF